MAGVLGRQHQQQPAARRRLNSTRSSSSASRRHTTRPAKFRDAWGIASNKRSLPRSRLRFASRAGVYVYLVTSVGHLSAATFGRSGSASISDAGKPSPDLAASMSRAGRNLLHMVARTEERSPLGREHGFAPLRVALHQSAGWWGLERSANTSRLPSKGASLVVALRAQPVWSRAFALRPQDGNGSPGESWNYRRHPPPLKRPPRQAAPPGERPTS